MSGQKIVIDDSKLKADIKLFAAEIGESLRVAMLESIELVGVNSVANFMTPHALDQGEFGKPGGKKRISPRAGGSKLGILTGRLSRSILDQEDTNYGREGIRKVDQRLGAVVGTIGSKTPYARIHEKGGTIHHTNLFGRGIKANITMPARPYLEPAAKMSEPGIREIFNKRMGKLVGEVF